MGILKPHPNLAMKRISLRVWSLRDQIESLIHHYLKEHHQDEIKLSDYREIIRQFNTEWILRDYFDLPEFKSEKDDSSYLNIEEQESKESEKENTQTVEDESKDVENTENSENEEKKEEEPSKKPAKEIEDPKYEIYKLLHRTRPNHELVGKGQTFLNDIDFTSINFFATRPFLIGQSILIEFKVPRKFVISGEIVRCINYNLESRIISDVRPQYRLQVRFTFKRTGERTLLRTFLESIHIKEDFAKSKSAPKKESSDEPSIDDLASLGL